MTTLDERPTAPPPETPPVGADVEAVEEVPSATASATALGGATLALNAQTRRARARVVRARARLAVLPVRARLAAMFAALGQLVRVETVLPSLLDARPRSLREQRDYIRAQQVGRPDPAGAVGTAKWRVAAEHAHDAGLRLLFLLKTAAMTVEWCCESYKRALILAAVIGGLIYLF